MLMRSWIGTVMLLASAVSLRAGDQWAVHESLYAEPIESCGPHAGVIENDALRTVNWPRGVVIFKDGGPGFHLRDGHLAMKFHWERKIAGALSISGQRLDGSGDKLGAAIPEGYGDSGFQATMLVFPGPGCWEVVGSIADHALVFRVFVINALKDQTKASFQVGESG